MGVSESEWSWGLPHCSSPLKCMQSFNECLLSTYYRVRHCFQPWAKGKSKALPLGATIRAEPNKQ